ncbi:type VI secretion system tip protein VgrG [Taibaiella soli]|uniref:Rhs element Vgr protein n=1 Tax=Taibaiella soli TaxID=1649169 RepID=A0A2W2BB36_9BACT|nr:type VI secretion system tip protein VgrG [Taibaiella soli]PZF73389.1 Rhs element Vgr protein [Taibaiella soli]
MLDSLPPGTAPATDVVSAKVFINETELSGEVLVAEISVSKQFNKIASAQVVFMDGSAADRDFPLSDDDTYKPGNLIRIQLGYHGDVTTVFEGVIVKHAIKIKPNGASRLIIDAKDKAIALTGARKSAYYTDKTDSDVITQLAGALTPDVESTTMSHKQLIQYDVTDWDFLVTRAEANSMLVLTDDGKLIVKKPDTSSTAVLVATYGDNIWDFDAEMDARRQVVSVMSTSWDYTQQQIEQSDKGQANFTETGNLSSDDLASVLGAEVNLIHPGHLTQEQLQNWSDAYAMRNHLSKAVGRMRVNGNSDVKPGTMVTLAGVGDRFNGAVFVTGVLHHFDGSWYSNIQFGWNEELFVKKEDVMNKPASGLLPGIYGLQIGVVLDLDDPEGQYRVKLTVPTITSGNDGFWARVATLDAGASRGVYFRPQIGDEVIVGFLNDDPNEPIILGYLHSKDNKASPLPEQEGQLQYGFVTQEGLKLVFDDTNKRLSMTVPTASGEKSIVINNDSGAFEMKDENQNTITMDASGITIQAGAGNVTIKGVTVMIN